MDITPWLPIIAGLCAGGGIWGVIVAVIARRTARGETVAKQTQTLIDGFQGDRKLFQEDRLEDRKHRLALEAKLDTALTRLDTALTRLMLEQVYSSALLQWGLNGAPPPPPSRPQPPTLPTPT